MVALVDFSNHDFINFFFQPILVTSEIFFYLELCPFLYNLLTRTKYKVHRDWTIYQGTRLRVTKNNVYFYSLSVFYLFIFIFIIYMDLSQCNLHNYVYEKKVCSTDSNLLFFFFVKCMTYNRSYNLNNLVMKLPLSSTPSEGVVSAP